MTTMATERSTTAETTAAEEEGRKKGREVARCLGYRDIGARTVVGIDSSGGIEEDDALDSGGAGVDLWRLRTLALQRGGLVNSRGRKLGWIKLAGVDELVFRKEHANIRLGAPENGLAYAEIQRALEEEMEVSRWHIQRERRALRTKAKRDDKGAATDRSSGNISPASSENDLASVRSPDKKRDENEARPSKSMSHASSVNTLSSLASFESENDLSTPLTANLSGTPRSVSFKGVELEPNHCAGAGVSFAAFATSKTDGASSPASACPSLASLDTANLDSPTSSDESPLVQSSSPPRALEASRPAAHFQWSLTPRRYRLHQYQKGSSEPTRAKKDRRPQERKLLVQIATSAFYLLQYEQDDSTLDIQCYTGLQDLIAVLLLHLESPSLTSLLLKQILKSHLYASTRENVSSDESFASCIDESASDDVGNAVGQEWDVLSLGFFPLLQVVEKELHARLGVEDEQSFLQERVFVFGAELRKWTSSWFCCHDALSLQVVSRLVDLFLASHPSMPLYLSAAILCHPVHREKLLAHAQHPSPFSSGSLLASLLDSLVSNLPQGLDGDGCADFVEQAISTALSFMKQVPPQDLTSLVKDYQGGILLPYISSEGLESTASTWTNRSQAPTDFGMIRRMFAETKVEAAPQVPPSSDAREQYQMALIASGLATFDSNKEDCDDCSAWKRPEMTPRKALVLGMALCAGAKLLQCQQGSASSEVIGSFAGGSPADSIGMALLVGLQSLMLPLTKLEPPQTSDDDIPDVGIDLLGTESAESLGTSPFMERPVVLINPEVLHDIFNSTPTSEDMLPIQEAEDDATEEVSLPGESASSHNTSLFTCEDEMPEEASLDDIALPSKSVSSGPDARSPYEMRNVDAIIDKLQDLLLETIATETREYMPVPPDRDGGRNPEHGNLLDPTVKKDEPKRPSVSIPGKVKSYASRSRKLGAGIKKRLKGIKKDYIALADGDELMI